MLLQIIATEQLPLLRRIKSDFAVQSAIVEAVESEVGWNLQNVPKFMGRQLQLKKAVGNGTIALINREFVTTLLGSSEVDGWIRLIETEGERLYARVDRGEAYSHAVSIALRLPVATHDMRAVNRLLADGEPVPSPILRFWDIVTLGHQIGCLDRGSCDSIRQKLRNLNERAHHCFASKSFSDGLNDFYPRLLDRDRPPLGAPNPQEKLDVRLLLTRISQLGLTTKAPTRDPRVE